MWQQIPADLLIHLGQFLHHRDARCMQATCTNWEQIWSISGLVSPHPCVQHIEMCDKFYCLNLHYVINTIEPFIMHGDISLTLHVLQFMMFLTPVKFVWSIADALHLKTLACLCIQSERYLVFWCDCTDHKQGDIPRICLQESDDHYEHDVKPLYTDSLCVWALLMSFSIAFLVIPIMISSTCFFLVLYRTFY
jgi:hypothetical protein